MMKIGLSLFGLLLVPLTAVGGQIMTSPDGCVQVTLSLNKGFPQISASYKGTGILTESDLKGFLLKDAQPLGQDVKATDTTKRTIDRTWKPAWGISSEVRDHYNSYKISLEENGPSARKINLTFRLYNDGFAYRYEIPTQPAISNIVVTEELNTFQFAGDFKTYALRMRNYSQNYEGLYKVMKLSEFRDEDIIAMPLLIEARDCWLAITEAALVDYSGMYLSGTGSGGRPSLVSELAFLPPRREGVKVKAAAPLSTPWRTFLVAEKPGDLITSNLILNLNAPSRIEDSSWLKPGKVVWPWWSGRIAMGKNVTADTKPLDKSQRGKGQDPHTGDLPPSTEVMKHYIDFAARNRFEHILIDAGWYSKEIDAWRTPQTQDITRMEPGRARQYSVKEVIEYAKAKGVGVHLWVHILSLAENMEALELYRKWGVSGIKIDSYGGDHQELVNLVHRIAEKCAENRLMLNFHGAYKPTGIRRTWPNFMTREAVYALEQSKSKPLPTPEHNVTLPFTRMLAGPMDYTPGAFDLDGIPRLPKQVQGTRAHQLAMYVVFFSPLQMLADYPAAYENSPKEFQFIKEVPVTWDQSKVLDGHPGDFLVMARKKAGSWFLGAMSDENGRELSISLDFLDAKKTYRADIYKDGPNAMDGSNREDVSVTHRHLTAQDTLTVRLAPGGGFAVSLISAK
jgi:alpha-glucosidase